MAAKRSHEDMDGDDHESGSPGPALSNDDAGGGWAKKRKFNTKSKHKAKEGTVVYSKKRARAIERLFQRDPDLPADVRNDMERELASHKATIADKAFQKRRSAMISKYHMVRFFERKKAMRHVKQLRSKIEKTSDPEDLRKLERELHIAQVNEAYALNYPHAEPYISLYKKEKDDDGAPEAKTSGDAQPRPPMWATVEKAMEEGPEALKALRERRSADESTGSAQSKSAPNKSRAKKPTPLNQQLKPPVRPPPPPPQAVKAVGKDGKQPPMNRRERRALMRKNAPPVQKDEDEDDGEGFFEEA